MLIPRFATAVGVSLVLAGGLVQAQTRVEPIRAQSGPSLARFSTIDVAEGSFVVYGRHDVYAPHMGISDIVTERAQVTERLQVFPLSGGDPTRAHFVCATHEGVLFGADVPCDQVRLSPAER